jgi:aminomethyltransferase
MGYVPSAMAVPDTKIFIQIRKKLVPATVVKLPFYKA